MKKFVIFLSVVSLVAAAASCKKEMSHQAIQKKGFVEMQFTATTDLADTKSFLEGKSVVWEIGEQVAVFDGISDTANVFTVYSASAGSYVIGGTVSEGATEFLAVYPYSAARSRVAGTDSLTIAIPNVQVIPTGKNIAPNALVSVAKAQGSSLNFKNVVSLAEITLSKDASTVMIQGNASEVVAGSTKALTTDGGCIGASKKKVRLDAESGTLAAGTYYAALLPTEFTSGIAVSIVEEDALWVKNSSAAVKFPRNGGFKLGKVRDIATSLPRNISSKAELDAWAQNVRLYPSTASVSLIADIDYQQGAWTPVDGYYGSFNGQGHSVYNLTINTNVNKAGFFAEIPGTAVVKDFKVGYNPGKTEYDGFSTIVYTKAEEDKPYVGGAIGIIAGGTVLVENIENYVPITIAIAETSVARCSIGGIAGAVSENASVQIKGCKNYGAINMSNVAEKITASQYIGGIVGLASGEGCIIESCVNAGAIEGSENKLLGIAFVGGILGRPTTSAVNLTIKDCKNEGDLNVMSNNGNYSPYVGGIIAADNTKVSTSSLPKLTVSGCENKGKVSCKNQSKGCSVAGIAAFINANSIIDNCINNGLVEKSGNMGDNSYIGGIVGKSSADAAAAVVSNCINNGKVYELAQTSTKTLCYGGIVGISHIGRIKNCTNNGTVETAGTGNGALCVGGIVGVLNASVITDCNSFGSVKETNNYSSSACGGLVGRMNDVSIETFAGCKVNCTLTSAHASSNGMVVGNYATGKTPTVVFGSAASPIKIAGSFNGTTLTAENYSTYIYGGSNPNATFHTAFLAE